MIRHLFLTACMFFTTDCFCYEDGMHAVVFNTINTQGVPTKYPQFSLQEAYNIKEHCYWPAGEQAIERRIKDTGMSIEEWKEKYKDVYRPLDETFTENLKKSRLLYLGQYLYGNFEDMFAGEIYGESIKEFLSNGGTIVFDYYSGYSAAQAFLESVGVDLPPWKKDAGYLSSYAWRGYGKHVLFNSPHRIGGEKVKAHGGFEGWADSQAALLRGAADRDNVAVLVIQENVMGSGRVIFNQTIMTFRERMPLTDNLLVHIYGFENFTGMVDDWKKHFDVWKQDFTDSADASIWGKDILSLLASWAAVEEKLSTMDKLVFQEKSSLFEESRELSKTTEVLRGKLLVEKLLGDNR